MWMIQWTTNRVHGSACVGQSFESSRWPTMFFGMFFWLFISFLKLLTFEVYALLHKAFLKRYITNRIKAKNEKFIAKVFLEATPKKWNGLGVLYRRVTFLPGHAKKCQGIEWVISKYLSFIHSLAPLAPAKRIFSAASGVESAEVRHHKISSGPGEVQWPVKHAESFCLIPV